MDEAQTLEMQKVQAQNEALKKQLEDFEGTLKAKDAEITLMRKLAESM